MLEHSDEYKKKTTTQHKNDLFSHLFCHYFFLICFQQFNWSFSVSFEFCIIFLFLPVSLRVFARLWRSYFFVYLLPFFALSFRHAICYFFWFVFSFCFVVVVKCFIWNRSEVFTNCFSYSRFFSLSLSWKALNVCDY